MQCERLFFALLPPPRVVQRLWEIQQALTVEGRPVPPENFHLTLAFLGDVPRHRIDALISACAQVRGRTLRLHLDHLGYFERPRIVYAGLESPPSALGQLSKTLRQCSHQQQASPKAQRFVPHVTLWRGASAITEQAAIPPIRWICKTFDLMRSQPTSRGVKYESLASFHLLPSPDAI